MATAPGKAHAIDRFRQAQGRRFLGLGHEEHGGPERPFTFVQMADPQLGMEATFVGPLASRGSRGWKTERELLQRAAMEVNRLKPAFCIVCGDLVNEWSPWEHGRSSAQADAELRARQVRDFKAATSLISPEIPLLCLCGNHDIGNRPNSLTIQDYSKDFGDDYFSFWCHGVRCLVLNSQLWKDDSDAREQRQAMDRWLEEELESHGHGRILVFSHISPCLEDPDEPEGYFNLEPSLRRRWLEKLADRGCVAWFAGHYHRNMQTVYKSQGGQELQVVTTGAIGTQIVNSQEETADPRGLSSVGGHEIGEGVSGFRMVSVLQDRVVHEWKTIRTLREEAACKPRGTKRRCSGL